MFSLTVMIDGDLLVTLQSQEQKSPYKQHCANKRGLFTWLALAGPQGYEETTRAFPDLEPEYSIVTVTLTIGFHDFF